MRKAQKTRVHIQMYKDLDFRIGTKAEFLTSFLAFSYPSFSGLSRAEPSQLQKLLSRAASLFQSAPTECEEVVAQKSGTREVLPVPSTPPMHSEPSVACEHSTV